MDAARKRWYADNNDVYQIMQRFRPIVPKPTGSPLNAPAVKSTTAGGGGGGRITNKRKYVKGGTAKNKRNKSAQTDSLFTLQLLPPEDNSTYTPAPPGERQACCILNNNNNNNNNILLPTSSSSSTTGGSSGVGGGMNNMSSKNKKVMMMEAALSFWDPSISLLLLLDRTVVETWVTVERVAGNCMDDDIGRGWCCSSSTEEDEMLMNLERDTSPGFISDGDNKVKWVNMAYRKMVMWDEEEEEEPPQVVVNLVADDDELASSISLLGFSCRVRVQFELMEKQQQCRQIVVPCDVWRLKEFVGGGGVGGLAWRLDVQTALSLGPP